MSEPSKVVPLSKPKAVKKAKKKRVLHFKRSTTTQHYPVQINVDAGLEPGPWLAINIQDQVFAMGWLPKKKVF